MNQGISFTAVAIFGLSQAIELRSSAALSS